MCGCSLSLSDAISRYVVPAAPDIPECAEPLIVPLWPACDVPLVVPVPVEDVPDVLEPVPLEDVPAVPEPVPVVDPLPLVVPLAPAPLPDIEEPDPLPIEAFVSIQLLLEPDKQPVTVTVPAVELLAVEL
jgi:hypothetical protein